jgi:hypothetical protein
MRTKLPVDDAEYLIDFAYMKAREVWPTAVVLDREAHPRFCRRHLPFNNTYGFDIFRSEDEVEQLMSGECCPPPPSVNVSWEAGEASLSGSADVVKHIAQQPLWSSA